MSRIDLNCDLGEGGEHDTELMPWVTSANIACGAHAGDAATMKGAVALAKQWGVAIGAHPGYEDRAHFGRRELQLESSTIEALVVRQFEALRALGPVRHLKPHGALYNQAGRDPRVAGAIVRAVLTVDRGVLLYGLAGGCLLAVGRAAGLTVVSEVFADRSYEADGSLTPRDRPGALLVDVDLAVAQVRQMVRHGTVTSRDGRVAPVCAETVCVHGDGPRALELIRRLREALGAEGVRLAPPGA
jgi:UPF0271 protein